MLHSPHFRINLLSTWLQIPLGQQVPMKQMAAMLRRSLIWTLQYRTQMSGPVTTSSIMKDQSISDKYILRSRKGQRDTI